METYPRRYTPSAVLAGRGSASEFRRSLHGVAVGPGRMVHAIGDGEVRVLEANGRVARSWKAPEKATSLAVGADGRVYVGSPGRVEIYAEAGNRVGGFAAGSAGKPADVTAIKVFGENVLVGDAAARLVRRYDANGVERGLIGDRHKTGSFMLPNRSLDIDVDSTGTVYATDTGRHQVTSWTLDGAPVAAFGRFGQAKPEDFVGCCNPVNIALAPDGCVVTAEKVAARVKVFGPDRSLLAVIGPEHFDPMCIHIHLAVDSNGRIVAADPVRRTITIFGQS
jgi:sugar lactone lactonase YvrE